MIVIKFGGSVLYELHPSIIEDIRKISLNEKMVLVQSRNSSFLQVVLEVGSPIRKQLKFIQW